MNWYRNQLLANASTQHAIIELQQELAGLKQRLSKTSGSACCDNQGSGTGSGTVISSGGLRNLLDGSIKEKGGLRGIETLEEGEDMLGDPYVQGSRAVALGNNTGAEADDSFVTGINNYIKGNLYIGNSLIGGSYNSMDTASFAGIFSAQSSQINNSANTSVILGGSGNIIDGASKSAILASISASIDNPGFLTENSLIAASSTALITDSFGSAMIGAFGNITPSYISNSQLSAILANKSSTITNAARTVIAGGQNHSINNVSDASIIGGINNSLGTGSDRSVILGGEGLFASAVDQAIFGKYNEANDDADIIIGGGVDNSNRKNSFALLTYKSGPNTGNQAIYVKYLLSDADYGGYASIPSGTIFADVTAGTDGNGNILLRYKP
jgi:hypothetical protein